MNRKGILLFLLGLFMIPGFVFADSGLNYDDTIRYVNNYISTFPKYGSYLFFDDDLPYVYENGDITYNSSFKSAGLLSKTEYEISNKNSNTYLANGLEYWTLTRSSANRHYVINYRLQEKNDSEKTGIRLTEYVDNNIAVSGGGSYANPWTFNELLSIHINSTNRIRGNIALTSCNNAKESVNLNFTKGGTSDIYLCPSDGYRVYTNSCSKYMIKDGDNKYIVSEIDRDNLICNIGFTYITYRVDLGGNPNPTVVYASTAKHDKWFKDSAGTEEITSITKPTQRGYTFKGYKKGSNTIINASGLFVDEATKYIGADMTLQPTFAPNTYGVSFSIPNATSSDHTLTTNVVFDANLPNITVPQRTYVVNYDAKGGTVSKSSDTISYNFEGYSYNGTKYYDSTGKGVKTWDIDSDVTLTGSWSGGNITLAIPTKSGHVFNGWSLNSNGSGTLYNGTLEVFNLISGNNTSVTLYANWTKCTAGTYLSENTCKTCAAGTYSNDAADSCLNCVAGKYSKKGASSCTNCAAGKWSNAGSSSCILDCDAGYACKDGSKTQCTAGKYSEAGSSTCTNCPAGQYSNAGASSCSNCAAGKWSNAGSSSCTLDCDAGYACKDGSKTQCTAGTYSEAGSSTCSNCGQGKYSAAGSSSCSDCPVGYRDGSNASSINECEKSISDGKYFNNGSIETCDGGYYKAAHNVKYNKTSSCLKCSEGYYSSDGASSCTQCPAGQYSSEGASSCSNCAAGKWSNAGSSSCTLNCDAGYACKDGSRTQCTAGKYSKAGASSCTNCPAGQYSSSKGSSSCSNCAAGKWSNAGSSSCTLDCDAGYACKDGSKTKCTAGTYSKAGASSCTQCPSGQTSGDGASECYSMYEDKWKAGLSGSEEFARTSQSSWASGGNIKVSWQEYYNEYYNQSYIRITDFQITSGSKPGPVWVGVGKNEVGGLYVNGDLVESMSYHLGGHLFSIWSTNTWISLYPEHKTPPWDSEKYTHDTEGTLSIPITLDLCVVGDSKIGSSWDCYACWSNVSQTITLTDLR